MTVIIYESKMDFHMTMHILRMYFLTGLFSHCWYFTLKYSVFQSIWKSFSNAGFNVTFKSNFKSYPALTCHLNKTPVIFDPHFHSNEYIIFISF